MPFLSLPLEIREEVYREVLCPPGGIDLEYSGKQLPSIGSQSGAPHHASTNVNAVSRNDYGDEKEIYRVAARQPFSAAILLVNSQVSQEATPVLFRHNRFNFDVSARHIHEFLVDRCPETKYLIRDIGFGPKSTNPFDDSCRDWWGELSRWILPQHSDDTRLSGQLGKLLGRFLHLDRLTFMVPQDLNCEVEGYQRIARMFSPDLIFWWPALDVALLLLLRGRIQVLRLKYSEKYTRGKVEDGIEIDPCERFKAIRRLRGICLDSPEWKFAVRRISDVDGDRGTVLELTKTSQG